MTVDGPPRRERQRVEQGPIQPPAVPLLALKGIVKSFPGCLANDRVDLEIRPGEIHALLGENGAGKSTLVKIIYGVLHPDAGEIRWQGRPIRIPSPNFARRLGIGMVFQHFSLFEALTVAENIALAIDDKALRRGCARASSRSPRPMACRSIPTAACMISRWASASASRSSAACCRIRSC